MHVTWSTFCRYMNKMRGTAPAAIWAQIRREGIERWKERLQSGYASEPLVFDDLVARLEASLLK